MIIDHQYKVHIINDYMERNFGNDRHQIFLKSMGEVLHCLNNEQSHKSCGNTGQCADCQIYSVGMQALQGKMITRKWVKKQLLIGKNENEITLLVSAAPVNYLGKSMAVLLLEDITELSQLRRRLKTVRSFAGLVGRHPKMLALFDAIEEMAQVDIPVLIQGESGTGKELVASAIHSEGPRSQQPFVAINCGAIPENLIESELFGHVRGAFTGAMHDKKGRFELADGGTLLLDELSEVSPAMQVKLLRVLQEGTFERVGSEKTTRVNIRIISATNKDLAQEVANGHFREDLYYRLAVMPITVPPLRDRLEDISLLAEHILRSIEKELKRERLVISPEVLQRFTNYAWPGNVRELQNVIKFAAVKCKKQLIEPEHLPPVFNNTDGKRVRKRKLTIPRVKDALEKNDGNKVQAAHSLGVSRATLYRFITDMKDAFS
ncbi:sigma-54-dependent Fis family transcriptional regulator [candidate division KSB1 bacterium]|nr:sigma-54-dependent Fis family transcriptional regulator [candidate division KSB1 bacterium]